MAHVIPDPPFFSAGQAAEREVCGWLRALNGKWTVIHGLCITKGHAGAVTNKPRLEIDFLLIGPAGIFGLEVKGGKIHRDGLKWVHTDRKGKEWFRYESPWTQVAGAMAALRKYFEFDIPPGTTVPWRKALFGSGVVMPDASFRVETSQSSAEGIDVDLETLYDRDDRPKESIAEFVQRVAEHWGTEYPKRGELTTADREALVEALLPHVEASVRVGRLAEILNEELDGYTRQQTAVVDGFARYQGVVVEGGPGTGKTRLAIHEAKRLAASASEEESVLVIGHNGNLVGYLTDELEDVQNVMVRGFHNLMEDLIDEHADLAEARRQRQRDEPRDAYSRRTIPELAAVALSRRPHKVAHLIVDEAQDLLSPEYAYLLDELRRKDARESRPTTWRLFFDRFQDVFGLLDPSGLELFTSEPGVMQYPLQTNCRNTGQIAEATALLSETPLQESARVAGMPVDYCWYTDGAEEGALVADRLSSLIGDGVPPHEIALLSRYNSANEKCEGLRNLPDVGVPILDLRSGVPRQEGAVVFSSVAGFKGLDADAVILMDSRLPRDDRDRQIERDKFYVGTSRARAHLSVMLHESLRDWFAALRAQ